VLGQAEKMPEGPERMAQRAIGAAHRERLYELNDRPQRKSEPREGSVKRTLEKGAWHMLHQLADQAGATRAQEAAGPASQPRVPAGKMRSVLDSRAQANQIAGEAKRGGMDANKAYDHTVKTLCDKGHDYGEARVHAEHAVNLHFKGAKGERAALAALQGLSKADGRGLLQEVVDGVEQALMPLLKGQDSKAG
jgi:hypothetical protein